MVDNNKEGIEKLLQATVVVLSIAIVGVLALLVKVSFLNTSTAPRTSVEKQLYDSQQALKKNPNDIQARMMLAFTYGQIGEFARSEKEYLTAIKLDKKNTKAYVLLAQLYEKQGKVDEAVETYQKIKDYEQALYELGRLSVKQKDYHKAIGYLKKALEKEPTGSDTLYYLGFSYEKTGNKGEAAKRYKEALKYTPDFKLASIALTRVEKAK